MEIFVLIMLRTKMLEHKKKYSSRYSIYRTVDWCDEDNQSY